MSAGPVKADEALGMDTEFMKQLDQVKNPFEDGLPKPIPVIVKPPKRIIQRPRPIVLPPKPLPMPIIVPTVETPEPLPNLRLGGVIVGDGIQQAIINDQVVSLHETIQGAQLDSVTKEGVKKYFH